MALPISPLRGRNASLPTGSGLRIFARRETAGSELTGGYGLASSTARRAMAPAFDGDSGPAST